MHRSHTHTHWYLSIYLSHTPILQQSPFRNWCPCHTQLFCKSKNLNLSTTPHRFCERKNLYLSIFMSHPPPHWNLSFYYAHLFTHPCLIEYLSIHLSIYLSIYLSIHLSIYPSIYLSIHDTHLFTHPFTHTHSASTRLRTSAQQLRWRVIHERGLQPAGVVLNPLASTVCCSVLQCVAACCSVWGLEQIGLVLNPLVSAVCCSVLQCAVVCCSVLQCLTLRCRVLQRVRTTTSRAGITVGVCVCVCNSQTTPHIGFECKGPFCE